MQSENWCHVVQFVVPNPCHVPQGGVWLLSPQHWAKTQKDTKPLQGTGSDINAHVASLCWQQRKYKLTAPLSPEENTATFYLALGHGKFEAFCADIGPKEEEAETGPMVVLDIGSSEGASVLPATPIPFRLNGPGTMQGPPWVITEDKQNRHHSDSPFTSLIWSHSIQEVAGDGSTRNTAWEASDLLDSCMHSLHVC